MTSSVATRVPKDVERLLETEATSGSQVLPPRRDNSAGSTRVDGPGQSGDELAAYIRKHAAISEQAEARALALRVMMARLEGVTFEDAAQILGTSSSKLARWLQGLDTVPAKKADKILSINRLIVELATVLSAEAIHQWLNDPLSKLNGSTPIDALRRGKLKQVIEVVAGYLEPSFG